MAAPTIEPLGDGALLLRWGDGIDAAVNARVHAFAARLRAAAPVWLVDAVPGYASLAVFFAAERIDARAGEGLGVAGREGDVAAETVAGVLSSLLVDDDAAVSGEDARLVEIPVCYGGALGPDLAAVAAHCGLAPDEVVARHTAAEYRVAMLGFSPGFPYLLGLDPTLATPRLATPRTRVPAGSVGIGGTQTGVYPDAGPGGWQLIGCTPLVLFDASRAAPSTLRPGDRLRFVAIDEARFRALSVAAR